MATGHYPFFVDRSEDHLPAVLFDAGYRYRTGHHACELRCTMHLMGPAREDGSRPEIWRGESTPEGRASLRAEIARLEYVALRARPLPYTVRESARILELRGQFATGVYSEAGQ